MNQSTDCTQTTLNIGNENTLGKLLEGVVTLYGKVGLGLNEFVV